MAVATLLLELYFAAMLGVCGLAKIENPTYFASTLRRHGILPQWSITGVSRLVSSVCGTLPPVGAVNRSPRGPSRP